MDRETVVAAVAALLVAAAVACAASIIVSSDYPLSQHSGRYAVELTVEGGRLYRVYRVHALAPIVVRVYVEPPEAGAAWVEPGGRGGTVALAPGEYDVIFRASNGYAGRATVVLEVLGRGIPLWLVAAAVAAVAAASLSRSEVRDRLRMAVYRLAAGLTYLIYRPEEALEHDLRAAIYEYLKERGGASISRLARHIGAYQNAVAWHLQVLERFGYVGHARIGRWTVYYYTGHMVEDWLSGFLASETKWGARVGRELLREKIRERRHEIAELLDRKALTASRLRKLLGL